MKTDRGEKITATVAGVLLIVLGVWALASPRHFFETVATFEPYNGHFLRDVGAFQIGLGAVLMLAARWSDSLLVALIGVGIGCLAHVISHVVDRHAGGNPTLDIAVLSVLTVVLLGAGVARHRRRGLQNPPLP